MGLLRKMSANHAAKYFKEKDPFNPSQQTGGTYYMNDPFSQGFAPDFTPEWWGKGAETLGLTGNIKEKDYENLLNGKDKKGNPLLHASAMRGNRDAGLDCVLAPPKSVSILALMEGDTGLLKAHDESVKSVLQYIEKNLVQYRQKNIPFASDNLAVALYQHSTSRNLDPQLHTHAYIANITQTPEGEWKAIHNKKIYAQQSLMISMYQSEMAKKVVALGYDLTTKANGKWEIQGVDQDIIKLFSSRSTEIKASLKDLRKLYPEVNEAKLRDIANLVTRVEKQDITKAELLDLWRSRLSLTKDHQEKLANYTQQVKEQEQTIATTLSKEEAEQFVNKVAKNISENSSVFNKHYLLCNAMDLSRGKLSPAEIEETYQRLVEKGDLIDYHKDDPDLKNHVVTKEILEKEQKVLELFQKGKGTYEPLIELKQIEDHVKDSTLTKGQQEAVKLMLTSQDRYSLIQGDAGTGKTFAVKTAKELLENNPKNQSQPELIGLGFTGRAAAELSESGGIKSMTIDKFLGLKKEQVAENPIYILDESSMLSTQHLSKLVDRFETEKARMVLIGDGKQLQAIGAGKLFRDLQEKSSVDMVQMTEVLRQKTPEMIKTVGHIKNFMDGEDRQGIVSALAVLKEQGNLNPSADRNELLSKLTEDYFKAKEEGHSPLIATPENKDRAIINDMIRSTMIEQGELKNEDSFEIRRPKSLHNLNSTKSESYQAGDKLYLRKDIGDLKAGQDCIIGAVNHDENTIVVNGTTISLLDHGKNGLSLFTSEEKDFGKGEKIVFLKGDSMLGFKNGQSGTIQNMQGDKLTVLLENGKETSFSVNQYPYFDHGYCSTLYKSQGSTCDMILYYAKEGRGYTEDFYTALTRAELEAILYIETKGNQKALDEIYKDLPQELKEKVNLQELAKTFEQRQEKTSSLDFEMPKELLEQIKALDAPDQSTPEKSAEEERLNPKESEDLQKEAPNVEPEMPKELLKQIKDLNAPEKSAEEEKLNQKENEGLSKDSPEKSKEKEAAPKETSSLDHNIPEELLEQIKGLDAPENELSIEQELQKMGRDSGEQSTSPEKESNDLEIELDR